MPDPRIFPIPRVNDTFATVGVVSTEVVAANPNRVDLELVNDCKEDMYLARGNPAVIGSGFKLVPNGTYNIDTQNLYCGAINAICLLGQANITVSEGTKP